MMTYPMPAWARRRAEQRDAERAERWRVRVMPLLDGLLQVDGLWSNASFEPFCLDCLAFAPTPVIEMGLDPETACAHCGAAVGAVAARKASQRA